MFAPGREKTPRPTREKNFGGRAGRINNRAGERRRPALPTATSPRHFRGARPPCMKEFPAIVRTLLSSSDGSAGHVLATLVSVSGSSYRRPGARLLLTGEKQRIGSISGGCLEEDVLIRAQRVAASGQAEVVTYDTSAENDLVWGVGLGCHGVVDILLEKLPPRPAWAGTLAANLRSRTATPLAVVWQSGNPARLGTHLASELPAISGDRVFLETVHPPTALTIFGAGDDAQPLLRLAKELGWHVTVADPRAAFATEERFPLADAVITGPAETLVTLANPQADSLVVVMTHHYIHDVPVLRELLARPLPYIGLLGPKKRAAQS